jgi:hypothetical protein
VRGNLPGENPSSWGKPFDPHTWNIRVFLYGAVGARY